MQKILFFSYILAAAQESQRCLKLFSPTKRVILYLLGHSSHFSHSFSLFSITVIFIFLYSFDLFFKGVLHTTGGYMVYTATTFKYAFDYKPSDVYWYDETQTYFFLPENFSLRTLSSLKYITMIFLYIRCTADCGWITGHSYVTYGPMLNGATNVIFEGVIHLN